MGLFIRAGERDHTMLAHLAAESAAGLFNLAPPPLAGIVVDAEVAAVNSKIADTADGAALPLIVDPQTPLLQSQQEASDPWAVLDFAGPEPVRVDDLRNGQVQDELIERTLSFQRKMRANHLVPPYVYSSTVGDAWLDINVSLLKRTAQWLKVHDVSLPVVPVFALSLSAYGPQNRWEPGLVRLVNAMKDLDVAFIAMSWSFSNFPKASYDSLMLLLAATRHLVDISPHPVVSWHQGVYGLPLAAIGTVGYETGIGQLEQLHFPQMQSRKKPETKQSQREKFAERRARDEAEGRKVSSMGTPTSIYTSAVGRSMPRRATQVLLEDSRISGALVCDPAYACCPDGAKSMYTDWREHSVRERARDLARINDMPSARRWRIRHVDQLGERAEQTARTANEILAEKGLRYRIPADTIGHLHRALGSILEQENRSAGRGGWPA